MTLKRIETEAMKLTARHRGELAASLLSSLDEVSSIEAETAWMNAAERRLCDLRSGKSVPIPSPTAFAAARSALRE